MRDNPLLTPAATPLPPMLVSVRDAAKLLAVCEKSLWSLTNRGELPSVKIGRSVRYSLADLQAFISKNKGCGQ